MVRTGRHSEDGHQRRHHLTADQERHTPEERQVNNDALVAALGLDAVAAVHGYRLAVLAEGQRRGGA